ncbi:Flp pilus assembly complex ATPase component TadA, partial [bacterium]|nr:Flp pilus assembly complex ATPase component TadA [bacterium]
MNEQLVKLKSSINKEVISKFDVNVFESAKFVPIDIKDNTLFAVISANTQKNLVDTEVKKVCNCNLKFLQVAPQELNDFIVSVVQEMINRNNLKLGSATPQGSTRKKLGEILVENGFITEIQLIEAIAESKKMGLPLGSTVYSMGFISLDQLKTALHQQSGVELVTTEMLRNQDKFVSMLPEDFIKTNKVIPISSDGKTIKLGMVDPSDTNVLKDIVYLTGQTPQPYLITQIEFQTSVNKYFSKEQTETRKIMKQVESDVLAYDAEDSIWDQIEKEMEDSTGSVAQLVNKIVTNAIESHASDIHIEPRLTNHIVRYRIDGILREVIEIPPKVENAVMTRFKVLSRMNIAEHRRPQDGSFSIKYQGKMFDFRINSLPVGGKEKLVIRVLAPPVSFDSTEKEIHIDGATAQDVEIIKKMIASPNGIILTSGPTGSGKTTTLYSLLKVLNTEDVNITTIEDPVEIKLEGVNQSQVNTKAGITFAFCMRAILRQDPDIILVGEIRDYETLEVA